MLTLIWSAQAFYKNPLALLGLQLHLDCSFTWRAASLGVQLYLNYSFFAQVASLCTQNFGSTLRDGRAGY